MCNLDDPRTSAFMETVRDAFRCMRSRDYAAGIARLAPLFDAFPEFRNRAHAYRAILLEQAGRFDEARADTLAAHSLSEPATQDRFTAELALAHDALRRGDADDELAWLRRALATAADAADPTLGGFSVAFTVLERVGDRLSPDEQSQIEATIRKGWPVLDLDGEPDLADVRGTLVRMRQRSGDRDYWSRRG